MFSFLKNINLLSSRTISGVEVIVGIDNSYNYSQVKNYYGNISVKKSGNSLHSIEELNAQIGKNKSIPFSPNPPVVLSVTGKQVILKEVEASVDEESSILLQKALPGAKMDKFYIQQYWNEDHWILTIIKKDILNAILNDFKTQGFDVVDIILGPLAVLPFITNDRLELPNYNLNVNENKLKIEPVFNDVGSDLKVEEDAIPFHQIIAFSTAFNFYSKTDYLDKIEHQELIKTQEEVKFNVYQIALLQLFFVLVLFMAITNYFLSLQYQNALSDLQSITAEQQVQYTTYENRQQELNQRINVLKITGVSSFSKSTFYADKIAELIPKSISLLVLDIGVLSNRMKPETKLNILKNKIQIKGVASNTLELNEFILKLEKEAWISTSIIENYNQEDRENPGLFEIKITINE